MGDSAGKQGGSKVGVGDECDISWSTPLSEKASGELSKAQRRRGGRRASSTRVLYVKATRVRPGWGQMLGS